VGRAVAALHPAPRGARACRGAARGSLLMGLSGVLALFESRGWCQTIWRSYVED